MRMLTACGNRRRGRPESGAALAALAALTAGLPGDAHAQVLEEVIVTAQKREQSVQDVGIAITAFSGDQIEQLGFTNSVDVASMSPGVYISGSSAGQNAQFVVRGVTQNDFLDAIEGPTAIYLDEGYVAQQNNGTFGLFDIERVEVLKGPQGTLFGRNATGGLVHFITRKPTATPEAYGEVTYGSHDNVNLQGAVSGPLSPTLAARASVYFNTHDDILKNIYPGGGGTAGTPPGGEPGDHWNDDTRAGRVQLLWNATDDVDVYLMGHGSRIEQGEAPYQASATAQVFDVVGGQVRQVNTVTIDPGETRNAICTPAAAPLVPACAGVRPVPGGDFFGWRDPDGPDFIVSKDWAFDDNNVFEMYGGNARVTWDLGGTTLTAISDYKKYDRSLTVDVDAGPVNQLVFNTITDNWDFSQEVRLNGETGQSRWVAGLYYLTIDAAVTNGFLIPQGSLFQGLGFGLLGVPVGSAWDAANQVGLETDSYSAFGQIEVDLAERFTVIAGLRVIREEKDFSLRSSAFVSTRLKEHDTGIRTFAFATSQEDVVATLIPGVVALGTGAPYTESTGDTLWTGKLQLNFRPADDWLLYAGVNRGVKAGAFNAPAPLTGAPLASADIGYDEEVLLSYEGGVKATVGSGTTRVNVSVYHYDYTDYHAFSFIGVSGIVTNQPATSTGVEFDVQSTPFEGLDVMFGVSAFDFEVEGVAVTPGNVKDVVPSFAPRLQMAGLVRYAWPVLGGEAAVQADANYHSNFFHNLNNFSANKYPAAVIGNLRLSWTSPAADWQLSGFVNNVADERNPTVGIDVAAVCGCNEDAYGKPRWFGVSARYAWR